MTTDCVTALKQLQLHLSDALPCKFRICIVGNYVPKLFINIIANKFSLTASLYIQQLHGSNQYSNFPELFS